MSVTSKLQQAALAAAIPHPPTAAHELQLAHELKSQYLLMSSNIVSHMLSCSQPFTLTLVKTSASPAWCRNGLHLLLDLCVDNY